MAGRHPVDATADATAERTRSPLISTVHTAPGRTLSHDATIAEVLEHRAVVPVYQPVSDLVTGAVVAYEALARGPRGTALERPDALFAAAAAAGLTAELDGLCREAALEGARGVLAAPWSLFVNVEPVAAPLGHAAARRDRLGRGALPSQGAPAPRVLVEITERHLTGRPAELLRMVAGFRARRMGDRAGRRRRRPRLARAAPAAAARRHQAGPPARPGPAQPRGRRDRPAR